jgi:acyl-CoA synthetase (NDP forming)
MGYERGLRFSEVVSIGNQGDLTIEDLLEYFATDTATKIIALYIEGIKRGKEFFRLIKETCIKKPIIVWKAGRSEVGARAVASHTGSLAGSNVVFDAALLQAGVAIAHNLDELVDLAVGFTCPVLPWGNKVALLVESGGGAVAGADAAELTNLQIPTFSAGVQEELLDILRGILPPFCAPRNPVDLVWPPATNRIQILMQCSRIMLKEVNSIVIINFEAYDERFIEAVTALRDEVGKPVFVVPGQSTVRRSGMGLITKSGVPAFTIPERAIKTISAMVRYTDYLQQTRER